jgi:Fic family protein
VKETAQQAADTSREILTLIEKHRRKIEELGRPAASVLRVHQHLPRKPIITIPATAEHLSLSAPTVAKALQHMVRLGMVRDTTGKQRHRLFTYHRYLEILNRSTEVAKTSY